MNDPLLNKQQRQNSSQIFNPSLKKVSYFSLFAYSTPIEKMYMAIGVIASIIAGIAFPFFLIYFGDVTRIFHVRQESVQKALDLAIKFFIIGSTYWIFMFIGLYCWSYSGSTQSARFKRIYYTTLIQQEVAWYDSNDANKLSTTIANNITTIQNAMGEKVSLLLSTIVSCGFGFIYAYFKCWELSLVLTGALPFIILAGGLLMKSHALNARRNKVSYEMASGKAQQALSAIRTIKCLVGEAFEVKRFLEALSVGKIKSMRYISMVGGSLAFFALVSIGIYGIGLWYGKNLILDNIDTNKYDSAVIIGAFFCFVSTGNTIGQFSPLIKSLAEGKVAFQELSDLIHRKKSLEEPRPGILIEKIESIKLKQVSFHYRNIESKEIQQKKQVLSKINLDFKREKVSALVGESGCGKSTIVQLLLRYYDCTSGTILVNDIDIAKIDINSFRQKIGFVGQEPVLFAMSIEQNLKLANPHLTQQEIINALKKANAWDFVEKMEQGIKSYVGTGGAQLSGGQKQRIAIARAICKNPQILILDEATSALDRKNEKQIQQTIKRLEQNNITTIVVAHRLSTIKDADTIFVFQKGMLAEDGKHHELINRKGVYYNLVQTQLMVEQKQQPSKNKQIQLKDSLLTNQLLQNYDTFNQRILEYEQNNDDQIKLTQHQLHKQLQINLEQEKEEADKNYKGVMKKLFYFSRPNWLYLLVGSVSALANGCVLPFFTLSFGNILALISDPVQNNDEIERYCIIFQIVALFSAISVFLYTFCFGIVGDRLVYDLRGKVYEKLMKLPLSFYDSKQNTPGMISTKLATDAYQVHNMITGILAVICLNLTTIFVALLLAFISSWKLALVVLSLAPLLMISSSINVKIVKSLSNKSEKSQKFLGSLISDTVCNIRTVKSFGHPQYFLEKFDQKIQELNIIALEKAIKISFFQGMRRAVIILAEGLIFLIAGLLYQNGYIESESQIFVATFAIIYCSNTVGQNNQHMPDMIKAKKAGAALFKLVECKDEYDLSLEAGGKLKHELKGEFELKGVTFKYPERDQVVLRNFSLKIGKGQKIALVGSSGSGKSTISQLLMRLYQPTKGEIYVDGRNIKEIDLYHYRRQMGIVNQEPTLFLGSILSNIKYNKKASFKKVQKYASITCSAKFIDQWQEKYSKQVGQKGAQISGGQKQRIALTRCLINKPKVLILDEATSALDVETEKNVFTNLKSTLKKRTSISIAHRYSTIQDSNRIIVMRDGQIIEEGNYEALMELKGRFYQLSKGQL